MKKNLTILMVLALSINNFSSCNANDVSMSDVENQVASVNNSNEKLKMNNNNRREEGEEVSGGVAKIIEEYVANGILTTGEAEELVQYIERNEPAQSENFNIIDNAVEEGIITSEQGSKIQLPSPPSNIETQEGIRRASGPSTGETVELEVANKIEEQLLLNVGYTATEGGYPIVDTNQTIFYNNNAVIEEPEVNDDFYGQDANYINNAPSYTDNGDGTVTDNVTGLMWSNGISEKMTWMEAVESLENFELGGYDDWRLPTMKELYSLVDFSGSTGKSSDTSVPYINTEYFGFEYGDVAGEARFIDSQFLTSTIYDSTTLGGATTVFGYNFADGRIKGYPVSKEFYVFYVRGNESYGQNLYIENGDGTITDEATNLMWMQYDSGYYDAGSNGDGTMDWEEALNWANDSQYGGYSDWRLPDIKELQSIVDYTKSPDTTNSAAIDDLFYCTEIENVFGQQDYGFYWSSTTHVDGISFGEIAKSNACYIAFGRGNGTMNGEASDAHGAGSQRSDAKTGDINEMPYIDYDAPQGDERRTFNMVRLVRDAE